MVFTGGYHGGVLGFWDGVQENNVDRNEWVVCRYNDVEGVKALIEREGGGGGDCCVLGGGDAGGWGVHFGD